MTQQKASATWTSGHGPLLNAQDLVVERAGRKVLNGTSLEIHSCESVSIMGPSGSGKSTFLHCLAGLIRPDTGSIRGAGTQLDQLSAAELRAWRLANCGLVFQFGELLPELTLKENAELPLLLLGSSRASASTRVDDLLARVQIDDVADRTPTEVSGGQMQRAEIVRAVAHRPAIILADEPTGALDAESARIVLDLLLALTQENGQALVLVSHDPSVAAKADRQLVMSDGVLRSGNPAWS